MKNMKKGEIVGILTDGGFTRSPTNRDIFIINTSSRVFPAYYPMIFRKRGLVRIGGALGIYFIDFETEWETIISPAERKINATLPMVMLIDNYRCFLESDIFHYSNDINKIKLDVKMLRDVVISLPKNIDDFACALTRQEILGISISEYLHITDFNAEDSLYYRKSAFFIRWFICRWPEHGKSLCNCLNMAQKLRLGLR